VLAVAAGAWLALSTRHEPVTDSSSAVSDTTGSPGAGDTGVAGASNSPSELSGEPGVSDGRDNEAPDPVIEAAQGIGLLGTWVMDDFSGMERVEGAPTTYEMKVLDGAVRLVPVDGDEPSDVMTVKQITDRAVTLTHADVGGKPFDYMYVFNLSADSNTLDDCATVAVSDFQNEGPCQWRYNRAVQSGAPSAHTRPEASCSVESAADPACVDAANKVGLIGSWQAGEDGGRYSFIVDGDAVRLAADGIDGVAKFAVRSIEGDTLTLGSTPFDDESEFDPQQTYEYDMTPDGARLVNCRSLVMLSAQTERSKCEDVPPFLVRASD